MGYSERVCQLCGVSFNIARIRREDEPVEAAWNYDGWGCVDIDSVECDANGCEDVERELPERVFPGGSRQAPQKLVEHLAGPRCLSTAGYSGHRISVDEMRECNRVQCILDKEEGWSPEPGDEDFVLAATSAWVTGISQGAPDEFDVTHLEPVLHGVSETMINGCDDGDSGWGTPMHPACFSIFQRMSKALCGSVKLDGLRTLWREEGDYDGFKSMSKSSDVQTVGDQWYYHMPGTEYLAAHPLRVPGLQELIQSCVSTETGRANVVFTVGNSNGGSRNDLLAALSPELKLMLLRLLPRKDVASLRLASRSFQQLPQTYFCELVHSEMPWISWDLESIPPHQVDWHELWCRLSAADGGSGVDERTRKLVNTRWYDGGYSWPLTWTELMHGLSEEQSEQLREYEKINRMSKTRDNPIPEEVKAKYKAMADALPAGASVWPKSTELKGLRNRRRIFGHVQKILRRIAAREDEPTA